ncbi:Alpha-terpineol synthase, chloroplastic [Linum perenne]
MAMNTLASSSSHGKLILSQRSSIVHHRASLRNNYLRVQCSSQSSNLPNAGVVTATTTTSTRRSGNYSPGIWGIRAPGEISVSVSADNKFRPSNHTVLDTTTTPFSSSNEITRVEELKKHVKSLLEEADHSNIVNRLELIDNLQRLGLAYHFGAELKKSFEAIAGYGNSNNNNDDDDEGLYSCALRFRLLRQAGFPVSQDVFNHFMDNKKSFKAELSTDIKGLLALYEASHLGVAGEEQVLDEARDFAVKHLKEAANSNIIEEQDPILAKKLDHALELPLHWRSRWAEACWFIQLFRQHDDVVSIPESLLDLALLDYNNLQQVHVEELEELTSWWKDLGLMEGAEFARDAMVESYLWSISASADPKMSGLRKATAKVAVIVHILDDAYDVYGFLGELELFTAAIERWDVNELDKLPRYLQLCFMAVYNLGNEMAYANLKQQGFNSLPYIKQSWADLCHSYLEEAKCYHSRRDQTLDQYLNVAWKSVACAIVLIQGYLSMPDETLTNETLDLIFKADLTRLTSIIVRLINDLASSKGELERGDVLKSVECYMKEKDSSEEVARDHIEKLISETWKMLNQEILVVPVDGSSSSPPLMPPSFVTMAVDVVRASHFMYKHRESRASSISSDVPDTMPLLSVVV